MSYGLGIDVGTTFTAAAIWRDGRADVVPLGNRSNAVPSVLFLRDDGVMLVGDAAEARAIAEPLRVAREFKRRVGDAVPVLLGDTAVPVQALFADMLRWVVERVTEREGEAPAHVTLTCPATWEDFRREQVIEAAGLAGLGEVGLLTEPEAAAVAYASNERLPAGAVVGVYDLGGGTFDATVLRKTADGFALHGQPSGDEHLGGVDFDQVVLDHVRAALGDRWEELDDTDPAVLAGLARLREDAVAAKELLSTDVETTISVILPGLTQQVRLTRSEFEAAVRRPLLSTVQTFRAALEAAGVSPAELHAVLLVGGSSRIPLVSELITRELGVAVAVDAHPKFAVCVGAAITAGARVGQEEGQRRRDRAAGLVAALPAADATEHLEVDLAASGLTAPADVRVQTPEVAPRETPVSADPAPAWGQDDQVHVAPGPVRPTAPDRFDWEAPPLRGEAPRDRRRPTALMAVLVAVALVVAAIVGVLLTRGDGDDVAEGDDPTTAPSLDPSPSPSPSAGPSPSPDPTGPTQRWAFDADGFWSSSPVVSDGLVFAGNQNREMFAIDIASGTPAWTAETGDAIFSSPAVAGGLVFVGSDDGSVYAWDAASGAPAWQFPTLDEQPVLSSPTVADGVVYVGCNDGRLYALDAATGEQIWVFPTGGAIWGRPRVADGQVYVGSGDGQLYAVDAATGEEVWNFRSAEGEGFFSGPTVAGGVVYAGNNDHNVYAVDIASGEQVWSFAAEDLVSSTAAVVDGTVYVGSFDDHVYALDATTGAERWRFDTGGNVFSSPAVVDGVVYVGSHSNAVFAIDAATGEQVWTFPTGGIVGPSPAVVDGTLYVGADDGLLYALDLPPP